MRGRRNELWFAFLFDALVPVPSQRSFTVPGARITLAMKITPNQN